MNYLAFIFVSLGLLLSVQAQDSCMARITAVARVGASWTDAFSSYQIYDITVENIGTCPLTTIVGFFGGPGRVTESWNYDYTSGVYSGFGGSLLPGQTFRGAGFTLANSTTTTLAITRFTCGSPCTTAPTTAAPTTAAPTTAAPTTVAPTTVAPTTTAPTTAAPTTPTGPAKCNVSVSLTRDAYSWTDEQGKSNSIYRVVVMNYGTCPLSAITINFSYYPALLGSTWNLESSLGGWMVKGYGYLANGAAYNGAGFILANATTVTVNVYGAQCTCN